ncbi:MAG: glycosyltransferase, partial [Myxococcales bacterium]|nr:glycosyltransferase [Myxococcales bacterium]
MSALSLAIVALTTGWTVLGTGAVARLTRTSSIALDGPEPVSVLKPLCGADPSLRENLRSFFEQDHPSFQLVFGVEHADDAALAVVRELMQAYPDVDAAIVVGNAVRAVNPKVRNLLGMLPHAKHDLVVISDSNVLAPCHYVRELAAIKASAPDIGLVTNLFAGHGERNIGAALECVELAGFVAAGSALPTALGDAAVIGKSMLFSRSQLGSLGGLDRVADVLAEDYVLGKMFELAGLRVVVAPTVLSNVIGALTLRGVFDRHLRWSMLRFRLRPAAFLLEPLTMPLCVLPLAALSWGPWALMWAIAMWFSRDVIGWYLLRGKRSI